MRITRDFGFAVTLTFATLLWSGAALAGSYAYTRLKVPGQQTSTALGINDGNQVVGMFYDTVKAGHGFVWQNGSYTQVDGAGGGQDTGLTRINALGIAIGSYLSGSGSVSFTYAVATAQQLILPKNHGYTLSASAIDDAGEIVGSASGPKGSAQMGFMSNVAGKQVTFLTVPGSYATLPAGINDSGVIAGTYLEPAPASHGFVYRGGSYTSFDALARHRHFLHCQ
jgi:probable HAF family extracellular repeat protein